jgi:hypothetical protein
MRFTLIYSGDLRANGKPDHKHQIRRCFHAQLAMLWSQLPLSENRSWFTVEADDKSIDLNRPVPPYRFVPLVSSALALICEVRIFLLRPDPPGALVTQAGDIDNRLKTLFDAMRVPRLTELPRGASPAPDEEPFFCLLEDDALISSIAVESERLLVPNRDPATVDLHIQVTTRATRATWGNLALA